MNQDLSNNSTELKRLERFGISLDSAKAHSVCFDRLRGQKWLAITSSALGHRAELHAAMCRYLTRAMVDARASGLGVLIAKGSAIEPWVVRAADLCSVPTIEIHCVKSKGNINDDDELAPNVLQIACERPAERDAVLIALADRVDCVYVRPRGKIYGAVVQRLALDDPGPVRVAVHGVGDSRKAAHALMKRGAVGWYIGSTFTEDVSAKQSLIETGSDRASLRVPTFVPSDWTESEDEWLVHCTRACNGPWPGQMTDQYRDELLLCDDPLAASLMRTPLETLRRILRTRRLIASSTASDSRWPVVCFSARPLSELLRQRSFRPHLHRWDYEPFGIAIRKSACVAAGFQPVIYGEPGDRNKLAKSDQFRFQATGKTFDWTTEHEWRYWGDVDLSAFSADDLRVFVPTGGDAARLSTRAIAANFPISIVDQCESHR